MRRPGAGRRIRRLAWLALAPLAGWGCGEGAWGRPQLVLDGSSTVYPLAEAVAEEFQRENPRVMVTLGRRGTGGGMEQFCRGLADVVTASRTLRSTEVAFCRERGVEFLEFPLALDGLVVAVHPSNGLVDCLSVEELRKIWRPGSPVRTWRDVRPELPPQPIRLYAPGTDSGTFDFFTAAVVGAVGASRTDYQASEDDYVLARGVAGDPYSLGYFGRSYLRGLEPRLKLLAVDGGGGCVYPEPPEIREGRYAPLARTLYLYVSKSALRRREVERFVDFFLREGPELAQEVGLVPLPDSAYVLGRLRLQHETSGFGGGGREE